MLVGIFELAFFIFFHFLYLLGFSSLLESGFLLLLISHRSSRFAVNVYTDSENVTCDLIYFQRFLGESCDSESFTVSSSSAFYIARCLRVFHVI